MKEQIRELIQQALMEQMCAESYFNNCDEEHFDEAVENLNNKILKLNALYRVAKFDRQN